MIPEIKVYLGFKFIFYQNMCFFCQKKRKKITCLSYYYYYEKLQTKVVKKRKQADYEAYFMLRYVVQT